MVERPPEEPDDGRPEEGPVLSPSELDITESEHVEQLDEGRFVVSPDARVDSSDERQSPTGPQPQPRTGPPARDTDGNPQPDRPDDRTPSPQHRQQDGSHTDLDAEAVHRWLRRSFEDSESRYAFDVTATFDGSVSQRRMASNDVVTIFESLMLWYAQQIDADTPVEEVLGILLMESNVPVRYPPESVRNLVKSSGLGPDDTIADLLAAVENEDGLQL